MKNNNFLIGLLLILGVLLNVNSMKAQAAASEGSNSDMVTLNIRLKPIQTIVVNPAQKTVEFLYVSTDNYGEGIMVTKDDHLSVFSTGAFEVSIKANNDNLTSSSGLSTIPVSDIKVTALAGSKANGGEEYTEVGLSTSEGLLISATKGGRDLTYNVTYDNSAGGNSEYIDKYFKTDGNESLYTADVTYTIAAK